MKRITLGIFLGLLMFFPYVGNAQEVHGNTDRKIAIIMEMIENLQRQIDFILSQEDNSSKEETDNDKQILSLEEDGNLVNIPLTPKALKKRGVRCSNCGVSRMWNWEDMEKNCTFEFYNNKYGIIEAKWTTCWY